MIFMVVLVSFLYSVSVWLLWGKSEQRHGHAPEEQVGRKGYVPCRFSFPCPFYAQVGQGKQAGEGKGDHQPGCPEGDAQQGRELDVPAADPAVCGKGDGEQEQEAGQGAHDAAKQGFRKRDLRAGSVRKRQVKEAPGQEGKQGSVAYPVVPVVIKRKSCKKQQGKRMVGKQQLIHVWNTSRRTGCPGSVRRRLH